MLLTSTGTFNSDLLLGSWGVGVSEILPVQRAPYITGEGVGEILRLRGHLLSTGHHKYSGVF